MTSGVVKVGRNLYAVGLFWQPSPSGRVAQAAREAAQQSGGHPSDFYCARSASKTATIPQFGLGGAGAGHKVGMPALAGSLANAQPGSWVGAFRLREGTWFVVVRDDLIAPDGDVLFTSDEAARDRMMQEIALGGMQRVYAPDGWSIAGSDPTPLPLLLQDRADCRMVPVKLPVKLIMFGGAAVLVIAIIIFVALYMQAERERLAREANNLLKNGSLSNMVEAYKWPPAEQLYEAVWQKKPTPQEVFEACKKLLAMAQATQLGWKRGELDFRGNVLTIAWSRVGKGVSSLLDHGKVADDLTSFNQTITTDVLPPRGNEALEPENVLNERALLEGWPVVITRLPDDTAPPPPANVKNPPPPPPPPWHKRSLKYTGTIPPWELWNYFDGMVGIVINEIKYNQTAWTVDMTIYEKRGHQ